MGPITVGSFPGMFSGGGLTLAGVLNTSPSDGLSGIWQGGGKLTFEADGSAFYFETGNGSGGAPTEFDAQGLPANGNYNEALVKVVADPTTDAVIKTSTAGA